jgi:hypothetical protein
MRLAPWVDVVRPHPDVESGSLDMGTYAVNLASVYRQRAGVERVYSEPEQFFATTYLTAALSDLLRDVMGVLGGDAGDRVLQLRTPFGGGKTHTLVALLHLVRSRPALAANSELAGIPDPGPVALAVLSGEELDPLSPIQWADGTATRTLWGELAKQLGRYDLVAEHDAVGSAPGGDILRQVLGDGPVLILLDEVLIYIEKALAIARAESTAGRQAMLFVQALTEVVKEHPKAAMVYSLQASVGEAMGAEGLLTQLDHLVSRVDAKREPVSGDEVMHVVQRRLFAELGDPAARDTVAAAYADLLRRQLEAEAETAEDRRDATEASARLGERIRASYPLHPELLDLMYHRWGSLPSYQRTRGALQFLACATHAAWRDRTSSTLLGPGDVDLSDEATRGAFFTQVGERERYASVLEADVLSDGSGAATVDRRIGADSPTLNNLRVGTRAATAIMLYSFGTPEGDERGVLERDVISSTLVPGLDRNVLVAGLHDLRDEELFLHFTSRRYRFEPTPNLSKLIRDEAVKLEAQEVLDGVRRELERELGQERNVVVWPAGPESIEDHVPAFTYAYLHPDWSADRQTPEAFVEQARGGRRAYRNAVALVLPDGAQFDRARSAARTAIAAESLLGRRSSLGLSREQAEELGEKAQAARRDLSVAVSRAYRSVALPVKSASGGSAFTMEELDLGTIVGTGRNLHGKVVEATSHRVFATVTVDKLMSLVGLGSDRPAVLVSDLVDGFFSYFDFTKLNAAAAIADAISRGVMEGRLGYAAGVEITDLGVRVSNPDLVRLGTMLPAGDIELGAGAAVVTRELAASLSVRTPPGDGPEGVGVGVEEGPVILVRGPGGGESEASPVVPPAPGERVKQLVLRAQVSQDQWFPLQRAMSSLREQAASMNITLEVTADGGESGLDPARLRNGVLEPLHEAGVVIEEERQ